MPGHGGIRTYDLWNTSLTDVELTADDVLPLLHSLNEHKATGPGGISKARY
jgi:hypothetical protein